MLPEEQKVPALLHGKLSSIFARQIFGVVNQEVIEAIIYHTTLRPKATLLDKILFAADKLCWEPEHAPFRQQMLEELAISLDRAVWSFLRWTWEQRDKLPVVHPWLQQAWEEMYLAQRDSQAERRTVPPSRAR